MRANVQGGSLSASVNRRRRGKRLDAPVSALVAGNQSLQEVLERAGIVTVRQLWEADDEELIRVPGLTRADMYVLAASLVSWLHSSRPPWYGRIEENILIAVFEC